MAEAFCLASGPSLNAEDVERVRLWRQPGRLVIVTNTTFRLAPWADMLFAMDRLWWTHHQDEVAGFAGEKYSSARQAMPFPVTHLRRPPFDHFGNSGAAAISLAIHKGAKKVFLLGYDCKIAPNGMRHWHGDHPKPLSNTGSIRRWSVYFDRVARHARRSRVAVVNCSRDTALSCFPRGRLEDVCAP